VHRFDAQLLQPLATDGALECAIGTRIRFRITAPENHHFTFFQSVLNRPVTLSAPLPHAVSPVVRRSPEPSFPAIRIGNDRSRSYRVHKTAVGAQVVADVSPSVVRPGAAHDGTRAIVPLDPLNFAGNDIQGFIASVFFCWAHPGRRRLQPRAASLKPRQISGLE